MGDMRRATLPTPDTVCYQSEPQAMQPDHRARTPVYQLPMTQQKVGIRNSD